ncbi:MAG: hypothetical protein KDD94_02060 [Calditrichaeota bacterium]|nr:hypothetical protein [Calditrichota bacterium]
MKFLVSLIICLQLVNAQNNYKNELIKLIMFEDTASTYFSVEKAARDFAELSDKYPDERLAAYSASHDLHQIAVYQNANDFKESALARLEKSKFYSDRAFEKRPNDEPDTLADLYANLSLLYYFFARVHRVNGLHIDANNYLQLRDESLAKAIKANPDNPRAKLLITTDFAGTAMKNQDLRQLMISQVLFADLYRQFNSDNTKNTFKPHWGKNWLKFWKPSVANALKTAIDSIK